MILAILQARCSSTRLPNKVLKLILNHPMIWHQWQRIQKSKRIDKCILATSDHLSDDNLAEYFIRNNQTVFRGNLYDVLERFYQCASIYQPNHVVRLTGDCPLIDPEIIDQTIAHHLSSQYDYTGILGFPNGMNTEICRFDVLEKTHREAFSQPAREHVTYDMYQQTSKLKIGHFICKENLSSLRLTVDYEDDFELIKRIYDGLYLENPDFNLKNITDFLKEHPELVKLNAHITQKLN